MVDFATVVKSGVSTKLGAAGVAVLPCKVRSIALWLPSAEVSAESELADTIIMAIIKNVLYHSSMTVTTSRSS